MKNNQAQQKRMMKVRNAFNGILPPMYALSVKIFLEVKKRFQQYREKEGLDKDSVICAEEAQKIVRALFQEWFQEIESTSLEIGRKVVRTFGVAPALEAWIFARQHIIKNKGQLNGIPIVWKGVDSYFKRYLPPGQLEELSKMEIEAESVEGQYEEKEAEPLPPKAIDSLKKTLEDMKGRGQDEGS